MINSQFQFQYIQHIADCHANGDRSEYLSANCQVPALNTNTHAAANEQISPAKARGCEP